MPSKDLLTCEEYACTECPIPKCRYDIPYWERKQRHKEIIKMLRKGESPKEVALHFEVTTRTVRRVGKRILGAVAR